MKDSVIREATNLWFVCALDVSVKALMLALVAALVLKLTRIANPNLRHRVWTGILLAMLALPVLSQLLPSLRLPFAIDTSWLLAEQESITTTEDQAPHTPEAIPTELLAVDPGSVIMDGLNQTTGPNRLVPMDDIGSRVASEHPSSVQSLASDERNAATDALSAETSVVAPAVASPAPGLQSKWIARVLRAVPPFLFLAWLVIAFLLLARLALALIGSNQLKRNSTSIALSDLSDLELPPELLNVRGKSLSLFECPQLKVPVTVGVLAPRVYLPTEWLEWANEKLVAVLTHERTHIERRDCAVIMLAELNRCLFWFHPLAWWLKTQLSALAEAACDDAVIGATGDRTTYAKHLLEVASVVARQPGRVASMGVSMARCSNVETRIHSILDFTRPLSQKLTKLTSASLLLVIVPIVIVAASLQPRSQTGLLEPRAEQSPLVSDDHEESRASNPDELQTAGVRTSITIEGMVFKPDGTAAAGASVRTHAWWWNWPSQFRRDEGSPPLFETTTGSDGRFSLKLPFGPDEKLSDAAWKDVWSEPSWKRLWNYSAVVASMPGYGGSWVALEQLVPSESITLRLVNEHPIRGKIIDLEGKPIAGATVQISSPTDGKAGSLDAWLSGIRAGEPVWTVYEKAGKSVEPKLLGISDKLKADTDGRFEIRGLGPECKLDLAFVGDTVAHREAIACTRKMEPISRLIIPDSSKQTEPVFGSDFIYSADPARIISGIVKDAATGERLAGVSVESYKLDGYPFAEHRVLKSVSDSQGRFQLIGMPKGSENELIVLPPDGMPFLTRLIKVPDSPGLGQIELQIDLNRGVMIAGRVTDKATGIGVPNCRLNYLPYRSNEFAQRTPEFGTDERGHDDQMRYTTDADGRFQLVGLPGKAVVGVVSVFQNYRAGFGYDELTGPKDGSSDRMDTYRNPVNPSPKWPNSMREVDIEAGAKSYSLDLQLDPGVSVRLAIQDVEGNLVTGTTIQGLATNGHIDTVQDAVQIATNFGPTESRSIIVRHDTRRIGRVIRVGYEEVKEEQLPVVLEPFATVQGRLMLDEGHAATGVVLEARVLPSEDFSPSLREVATDLEGTFQLDLLSGCKYNLTIRGNQFGTSSLAKELTIVPGQILDLGIMMLQGEEFIAVQQPTNKNESGDDSKMKSQNAMPSMKRLDVEAPASTVGEIPSPNSKRPTSIAGTIRDEAGKEIAGANLYMTGVQTLEIEGGFIEPKLVLVDKAISTAEGRFELKLPSDEKKLERLKILASAEGYGLQWREVPSVSIPEGLDLVMPKLLPIRLRLVDIDGRPAQGVSLAVSVLMRAGTSMNNQDFIGPYKELPELTQLWPPSQKTDSDGRCQILNVGAGLGAYAQVEGNDLFAPQALMINSGDAEERGENDGTYRDQVKNVAGDREVVIPLAPAQIFEGQITLADTGKPAAGVKVGVWASQQEFGSMMTVNGKANDQGRYRITPQSGIRFGVTAFPAKGEPYLAKTVSRIPWGAGLKSKTVDIALPRGVLIRGRVQDADTKAPIAGVNVQYKPHYKNPNNSDDIVTGWQCLERTNEDGTFQLSVLAGTGTLIVHGPRDTYVLKEMSGRELAGGKIGGERHYANAFVPLDLPSSPDPQELTIEIERGKKVVGKLVDENRSPIERALLITRLKISALHSTWQGFKYEVEGGQFELSNLAPGVEYNCSFLDPQRKLGATVSLRSDTPEPIVVLKKCGSAKMRFVTSKGEPREGAHSLLNIVITPGVARFSEETRSGALSADEDFVANYDRVNYENGPKTDADGRMELPALIPGATYRITGKIKGKSTHKDFSVEPGETIDLGEIILDRE